MCMNTGTSYKYNTQFNEVYFLNYCIKTISNKYHVSNTDEYCGRNQHKIKIRACLSCYYKNKFVCPFKSE